MGSRAQLKPASVSSARSTRPMPEASSRWSSAEATARPILRKRCSLRCNFAATELPKAWFATANRRLPSLELRLSLFHKGLPAFAKILAVHARDADIPDRLHVAPAHVLQDLCDGDLRRLDCQRRVTGNRARDLHGRIPQLTVWQYSVDQADAQGFGGIDPHPRVQEK